MDAGYALMLEPAMKLLYRQQNGSLEFWANGEPVCVSKAFENNYTWPMVKSLIFDKQLNDTEIREDIAQLLNDAILMLLPPN